MIIIGSGQSRTGKSTILKSFKMLNFEYVYAGEKMREMAVKWYRKKFPNKLPQELNPHNAIVNKTVFPAFHKYLSTEEKNNITDKKLECYILEKIATALKNNKNLIIDSRIWAHLIKKIQNNEKLTNDFEEIYNKTSAISYNTSIALIKENKNKFFTFTITAEDNAKKFRIRQDILKSSKQIDDLDAEVERNLEKALTRDKQDSARYEKIYKINILEQKNFENIYNLIIDNSSIQDIEIKNNNLFSNDSLLRNIDNKNILFASKITFLALIKFLYENNILKSDSSKKLAEVIDKFMKIDEQFKNAITLRIIEQTGCNI